MKEIKIQTTGLLQNNPHLPVRAEMIEGSPIVVTVEPTWTPRNYRESECIWDDTGDSGDVYKCYYVSSKNAWYYVTITAI